MRKEGGGQLGWQSEPGPPPVQVKDLARRDGRGCLAVAAAAAATAAFAAVAAAAKPLAPLGARGRAGGFGGRGVVAGMVEGGVDSAPFGPRLFLAGSFYVFECIFAIALVMS